jgi:hypothetical protein
VPLFSFLGFYNEVEKFEPGSEGCLTGDAIDDLCDIVNEFRDVLWRFENTNEADAFWNLRNGYFVHWGAHIRGLQYYLFRSQAG